MGSYPSGWVSDTITFGKCDPSSSQTLQAPSCSEPWWESSSTVLWRWDLLSFASAGSKYSAGCRIVRLLVTFGPLTSSSGTFLIHSLPERDLWHILILSMAILQTMENCQLHLHCWIDFMHSLSFCIFSFLFSFFFISYLFISSAILPLSNPHSLIFTTFMQQIVVMLSAHKESC